MYVCFSQPQPSLLIVVCAIANPVQGLPNGKISKGHLRSSNGGIKKKKKKKRRRKKKKSQKADARKKRKLDIDRWGMQRRAGTSKKKVLVK